MPTISFKGRHYRHDMKRFAIFFFPLKFSVTLPLLHGSASLSCTVCRRFRVIDRHGHAAPTAKVVSADIVQPLCAFRVLTDFHNFKVRPTE